MKKALIISFLTALTLTSMSCSDDKKAPELCSAKNYPVCDGDTLLTCDDNQREKSEICPAGCIGEKGHAECKKTENNDSGISHPSEPGTTPAGCGDITAKGICDGNVAKVCSDDKIKSRTCGTGTHCGAGDDGVATCLRDEPSEPKPPATEWNYQSGDACGSITVNGACSPDGTKLAYCNDQNKLTVQNCSPACAVITDVADCYEPCPADLDLVGQCTDIGFEYCNEDNLHVIRTCDEGFHCGKHEDGYYTCLEDV